MPASTETVQPWYIATISTLAGVLFGAIVGFGVDRAKAWFDARKVRKAFLAAVRIELERLREQLDAIAQMASKNWLFCDQGAKPIEMVAPLKTRVFDSQLGNLKDLADSLLLDIVHFYSDLGALSDMLAIVRERLHAIPAWTGTPNRTEPYNTLRTAYGDLKNESVDLSKETSGLLVKLENK